VPWVQLWIRLDELTVLPTARLLVSVTTAPVLRTLSQFCWQEAQLPQRQRAMRTMLILMWAMCTVWLQCTPLSNRRYWRTVKRPLKVNQGHPLLCQSTRHRHYDFLLALNSNLTSVFNRSWYINIARQSQPTQWTPRTVLEAM